MDKIYSKYRKTKKAFTLVELLMVISCAMLLLNLAIKEVTNQKTLRNELYMTENLDTVYKITTDTVRATRNYDEKKTIINLQEGLTNVKSETRSGFRYVDYEADYYKNIDGAHYIYILHNGLAFKDDLANINAKNTIFVVVTKTRVEIYYTTNTVTVPKLYKATDI